MNYSGISFQKETIDKLNISTYDIICSSDIKITAECLLVPYSPMLYSGHMPKWVCKLLRELFLLKGNKKENLGYDYIYITREKAIYRRVINEDEIFQFLESMGFKKIYLENLSIEEQASVMNNAKVIVAPHGAGLANLVFCKPGTKVLEIFSPNYVNTLYHTLSSQIGLDYSYSIGIGEIAPVGVDPHIVSDDILADLNHIKQFIEYCGI